MHFKKFKYFIKSSLIIPLLTLIIFLTYLPGYALKHPVSDEIDRCGNATGDKLNFLTRMELLKFRMILMKDGREDELDEAHKLKLEANKRKEDDHPLKLEANRREEEAHKLKLDPHHCEDEDNKLKLEANKREDEAHKFELELHKCEGEGHKLKLEANKREEEVHKVGTNLKWNRISAKVKPTNL